MPIKLSDLNELKDKIDAYYSNLIDSAPDTIGENMINYWETQALENIADVDSIIELARFHDMLDAD
jgi:hypothetical protein